MPLQFLSSEIMTKSRPLRLKPLSHHSLNPTPLNLRTLNTEGFCTGFVKKVPAGSEEDPNLDNKTLG